jgi:hypothetical protein
MPDDDKPVPYIADEHVRYVTVEDILIADAYDRHVNYVRSEYQPRHAYDKRDIETYYVTDGEYRDPFTHPAERTRHARIRVRFSIATRPTGQHR